MVMVFAEATQVRSLATSVNIIAVPNLTWDRLDPLTACRSDKPHFRTTQSGVRGITSRPVRRRSVPSWKFFERIRTTNRPRVQRGLFSYLAGILVVKKEPKATMK